MRWTSVFVSVCVCVHLIRPTAEDSSLANYTKFSFSSLSPPVSSQTNTTICILLNELQIAPPPKEKLA